MSAEEGEIEEGEITDSDSMGEEQQPPKTDKPQAQQYSIFDNQPRTTTATKSIRRPPHSESDNSDNNDDGNSSDDDNTKKRKFLVGKAGSNHSKPFVNPNFVNNGGRMPPVPRHSGRSIWGSVLQEQILTAEVGNFSMEKKLTGDRDVESYDYTRAKDDDRPHQVDESEMKNADEDLFGEVIDLEKVAFKQRRNLKRKHVAERLGKRPSVKERIQLPRVTENSSVEEVTYFISSKLQENKVHLIKRVVSVIGRTKALSLLAETEKVEAGGGMLIMNGSRRRTPGGVYLTLLKMDKGVSKEKLDEIFEEENKWTLELRKRKKARARRRRKEREGPRKPSATSAAAATADDKGNKGSSMELLEDSNSRSSVEGQTGSPRHDADHLSDTQEGYEPKEHDSARSDSEEEGEDKSEAEDFEGQLARELKRQAKETKVSSAGGDADAITLDDVLDLEVEDDFID
ncbi:uncharacterized protein LOC143282197 [Babylonia areolata]|uniref:uncharacterized protein LOC143282197 n=1 Tax=Babylonia areolata TaxID=304850 RepID=UPI003FD68F34